ncbi:MAG: hypothetical protein JXC32_01525 [Anaerolineae bacterium]|nr:hypothetical protein [Anaerolineae bacterium]
MIAQLVGLGFALIGILALAVYSISQGRMRAQKLDAVPAFRAFSNEVGRVAEEGAAIHAALGSGDFLGEQGLVGIAALQGLTNLMDLAAAYDTPPFITAGDPTLYLVADNQLKDAYARLDNVRNYRPGFVRYIPASPVLYAAMAATLIFDESVGTHLNLGSFGAEASLLTDAALRNNTKVLGGTVSAEGIAAMASAVEPDALIMGEKLFAGGAEVVGRPVFWASLRAEDLLRWLVIAGIVLAAIASLLGIGV